MPSGLCPRHLERTGSPCARCGTFGCLECLTEGLCPACHVAHGLVAPAPGDTVGFGMRLLARLIDMVAGYAMAIAGGAAAGITLALLSQAGFVAPGWQQRIGAGFGLNFLAGLVSSIVAAALSTWLCGASLGKALMKLRVVRSDGGRPSFGQGLGREALLYVDAIFFGLVAYHAMDKSPHHQRLGDSAAQTMVIRAERVSASVRATFGALVAGVSAGLITRAFVLGCCYVAFSW